MKDDHTSTAQVALFAALTAALGMVPKIDLPLGVPVTPQTLGVMLAGCLLGPRLAFAAMGLFLLGVAIGLPILSGGRGGIGVFAAPSAGYVLGWPLGALVAAFAMRALPLASPRQAAWAAGAASIVGGLGVVHACGVVGLVLIAKLTWQQALLGSLLFVPGDLLKAGLCALIVHAVARALPGWKNRVSEA